MKIDKLSDLKKLIKLCRETGVTDMDIDGLKFHLGSEPIQYKEPEVLVQDPLATAKISIPQDTDRIETPSMLTEEQMLFYSVTPEAAAEEIKQ